MAARHVQRMLLENRIETGVRQRVALDEAVDGLKQYVECMTDGKMIITPWPGFT